MMRAAPSRWRLIPLLLITFWLGARSLDSDSIWLDEYFSIYDAGGGAYGPLSPADIWARVATRNPWHAPGYFTLLGGWGAAVGWEPAALRAFSLLFGVLTVAGTYRLGVDLVSRRVGLYAAVVLGTSAFFVYYLHEIRMYTLVAFLVVMALIVYARLLRVPQANRALWLGWLACLVAVLYAHYLTLIPMAGLAVYHLVFAPKNRRWWHITGIAALAFALFLPWLPSLLAGVGLAAEADTLHDRAIGTRHLLQLLATLFGNGSLLLPVLSLLPALLARGRGARFLWVVTIVAILVVSVLNELFQIIPVTRIRYLLSLWALLALLVALGIDRLRRVPLLASALLAVWVVSGVYNVGNSQFFVETPSAPYVFPLHAIDDALREDGLPGDFVVNYLSDGMASITYDRTADFYYRRRGMAFDNVEPKGSPEAQTAEHAEALERLSAHDRVWLAYVPRDARSNMAVFMALLEEDYRRCEVVLDAPDLRLELYARRSC